MHINKKVLINASFDIPVKEGLMYYKINESGFKNRWFKLFANFLYYYNCDSPVRGAIEPSGVFILKNFVTIRDNENLTNSFTINPEVKYQFFCMTSKQSNEWFELLSTLSYQQQRISLNALRSQIKAITGADPLEFTGWKLN